MRLLLVCLFILAWAYPFFCFALRINEVCSSSSSIITDHLGRYSDWIEIKNTTVETIDLNLYCLSDSPNNLTKFRFPAGSSLQPGQIILIWAVNEPTVVAPNGEFCGTNFAISASGEPVILSLFSSSAIIDQMPVMAIPTDHSYGRIGSGNEWYFFTQPTPREENTTPGYLTLLDAPIATQNSGWFQNSVNVNFVTNQTGVQIRYTTDGSEPKDNSPVWPGATVLYDRSNDPNVWCMIPTVLPNLPEPVNELDWWFPPASSIPKIHTIKVKCFATGSLPSDTITRSYIVGINLYDFPIVSLTMDPMDLFDDDIGIYVAGNSYNGISFQSANFMQDWERPIYSEWFDLSGNLIYQKQSLVEVHGTYTARAGQKSLRFKTTSNPSNYINFPFFGDDYLNSFRYLILRNSGNDVHMTLFRDNFIQTLLQEQHLDVSRFRPHIVFLNGEYWGIHTLQERMDEYWVSGHYDIPVSQLDVLERDVSTLCGDNLDYNTLLNYIVQNDVTNPSVWQYLETKIDMCNFREYMVGQVYAGNTDWPGNNIRYWRKRVPFTADAPYGHDGKWRWLVYDMDFSYGLYQNPYWSHDTLNRALNDSLGWRTLLLRSLIQNQQFKIDFINNFADRLNSNWLSGKIITTIDQYEQEFETSIPEHIARWSMPANMSLWSGEVNALRAFANNRPNFLRSLIVQRFELPGTADVALQIQPEHAAVIRLNNTVDLHTGNYTYFQGVPIKLKAIPAPGWEVINFNGVISDTISIVPSAQQIIQLTLQQTVSNDDEWINSDDLWRVVLSPNPVQKSTDGLRIQFIGTGYKTAANFRLIMYNVKGQRIRSLLIDDSLVKKGEISVATIDLPSGLYIVKLAHGQSIRSVKKITVK